MALPGKLVADPDGTVVPRSGEAEAAVSVPVERARSRVTALYDERAEEFLHFAMSIARDEELAKDALQEAFMRFFVAVSKGAEITSPRAWIYRVMHNYLLDRIKETRRCREYEVYDERSWPSRDIEDECTQHELMRRFRKALTAREYDCLHLRTEGLRYEEIAATLNLASGTVGALMCRAARKIRGIAS